MVVGLIGGVTNVTEIRVLIVEDYEPDAWRLRRALSECGLKYEYKECISLESVAVELVNFTPSIIFLDLNLLHSDGIETLLRLRKMAPETPLVVYSGTVRNEDLRALMQERAALLRKDQELTTPTLRRAIMKALGSARDDAGKYQEDESLAPTLEDIPSEAWDKAIKQLEKLRELA